MKKDLFRISQVAKFLSITTTALRYYESEGLVVPAYVDDTTKYRYYDINNVNRVSYIIALRDAGATMLQIKSYFANQSSMENLLEELIAEHKKLQQKISFLQDVFNSSKSDYEVKKIKLPTIQYISNDYIAKDVSHAFSLVQTFLKEAVDKTALNNVPVTFIEYDTLDFSITDFPITIGIEVASSKEKVKTREKQNAIRTIHHGSYETLPSAYDALMDYAEKNNLQLKGNVYEYYFESLNLRNDPDDFVTEIIMPLL